MVSMAAISLWRQQQISPSGGGRRVSPPLSPQKIMGKIGHHFFDETKVYIKRWRRDDHRGQTGPGGVIVQVGRATYARLAHVLPLVCYHLSRCFS
jgi:hypothetical protein